MHRQSGDRAGQRNYRVLRRPAGLLGLKAPPAAQSARLLERFRCGSRRRFSQRIVRLHIAVRLPLERAPIALKAHRAVLLLGAFSMFAQHGGCDFFLICAAAVERQLGQRDVLRKRERRIQLHPSGAHQRAQIGLKLTRSPVALPAAYRQIAQQKQVDRKQYCDQYIFDFIPLQALSSPFCGHSAAFFR